MRYMGIFKVILIQIIFLVHLTFITSLSNPFTIIILMLFCMIQIPALLLYKHLRKVANLNTPYIFAKTNEAFTYAIIIIIVSMLLLISKSVNFTSSILYYDLLINIINMVMAVILGFFASTTLVNGFVLVDSRKKDNM